MLLTTLDRSDLLTYCYDSRILFFSVHGILCYIKYLS